MKRVRETVLLHPNLRESREDKEVLALGLTPQGYASAPPEVSSKADSTAGACLTYQNEFLGRSKSLLATAFPDC